MSEYIVQVKEGGEVTKVVIMAADRKTPTLAAANAAGFQFASKFKVKDRAEKIAKRVGGEVVNSYGGYVHGSKSSVAPLANKVNRSAPYKSM